MAVFMISYDLNKHGKDYPALFKAIKDCSSKEPWHGLDSTWLIKSSMSADAISKHIREATDSDDNHLVIEVINNKQGWLDKADWEHINSLFW
jgi:hypothetical protein